MPHVTADDGVKLYYEEAGSGRPIVFVHEFAGDHRSWEPQLRHFSRTHRCIAFNARGYPPSDIPEDPEMYSQDRARDDILALLDGLGIERAHINGLSMGGFATLHFGLEYPDRALSLVVAGCGYGAKADARERFYQETTEAAQRMEDETMAVFGRVYALGPTRVQFQNKDPRGWQEFTDQLCEHSSLGSANTMRGVQRRRPSLFDLEERMRALTVPTLVINGDEDDPCLDARVVHEADHRLLGAGATAAHRAFVQSRGAGALQPVLRRLHGTGGGGALGSARPALDDRRDHLGEGGVAGSGDVQASAVARPADGHIPAGLEHFVARFPRNHARDDFGAVRQAHQMGDGQSQVYCLDIGRGHDLP